MRTGGRGGAVPVALLGALLLIAFRGPLAGRVFYLRDVSQNHVPIRHLVAERMLAGSLPLWDPYHGAGTPLLANPNALVLHPISALFLILPFDAAFTASILLQFLLLAWGGYLLARRLTRSREGAALAAAVLSLSGPAASLASQQNVLSAAAWVPLAVWAFLRGLEPQRRKWLSLASLLLAVILITGEPASLLAFGLLAAALGATKGGDLADPGQVRRAFGALLGVGLVALALAAVQILPARELLLIAARGAGFSPQEGMKWSLEPSRLLEMIVPWIFGDPTRLSPQAWWGGWLFEGRYPFLLSIYLGAIPFLLAAIALSGRGQGAARRWSLGAIAGLGLLLSLGRHSLLYRALFAACPAVRQLRYPERYLLVTLFAAALLAAIGLDRLLHDAAAWRRRSVATIFGAAAAAFLAVTLVASSPALVDRLLAAAARVPGALLQSDAGAALHGAILRSALWAFAETALLALAAMLSLRLQDPRPRAGRVAGWTGLAASGAVSGWGVVAVSGLSMTLAAGPVLSTAARDWLTAASPLAGIVGRGPGAPRLHHDPRPPDLRVWGTTDELVWGYRFDRFAYALASGHGDHVPTVLDAATDQMDLKSQAELGRDLARLMLQDKIRVLSICGAGYLITTEQLSHPDLEPIPALEAFSLPPTRVYRIASVLPRARLVAGAARPSHPGDVAASLSDRGWDPSRSVLLDEAPESPAPEAAGAPGTATILVDRPERIAIRVEAASRAYLVLSDAYAPGWRLLLDGAPAPLLRANGLFRAVAVDPGAHEVVMTYCPASLLRGAIISLVGLAVAGGFWAMAGRRRL